MKCRRADAALQNHVGLIRSLPFCPRTGEDPVVRLILRSLQTTWGICRNGKTPKDVVWEAPQRGNLEASQLCTETLPVTNWFPTLKLLECPLSCHYDCDFGSFVKDRPECRPFNLNAKSLNHGTSTSALACYHQLTLAPDRSWRTGAIMFLLGHCVTRARIRRFDRPAGRPRNSVTAVQLRLFGWKEEHLVPPTSSPARSGPNKHPVGPASLAALSEGLSIFELFSAVVVLETTGG